MKKLLFAAALLLAVTASAQKKLEISQLPAPALAFVEKHFPGVPVTTVRKDTENGNKGYEVKLSNGVEVEFRSDGSYREVDGNGTPIPTDFIDSKILEYVGKNYPNNKITHIDYDRKHLDVDLTGGIDLEFTHDGKFLKAEKD